MSILDRLNGPAVGNWLIDAEHRQIVVLMDEVENSAIAGLDGSVVRAKFERLIAWIAQHFAHEDDSIRRSSFSEGLQHIEEHKRLLNALTGFASAAPKGHDGTERVLEAIRFLETWLAEHIAGPDTRFAAHLRAKGLQ